MVTASSESNPSPAHLTASNLHYQFGRREILRGLDFKLSAGRVTAFLGRNGAGKTTTLNLLAGVLKPGSGEVLDANGLAPWFDQTLRARIGYLPETPPLYPECTVFEQLKFAANLRGIDPGAVQAAVNRALDCCDLGEVVSRLTDQLSKGFRQRVALAQAIVHQPDILLLDEPGSGLDPVQMDALRRLIETLAQDACVVFSTHLLSEALSIGNDILVIRDGQQQFFGACSELPGARSTTYKLRLEAVVDTARLEQIEGIKTARENGGNHWLVQLDDNATAAKVSAAIVAKGWGLCELAQHKQREQQLLAMMAGGEVRP
jgi:ABC-2 type transport system ATP-binding protein